MQAFSSRYDAALALAARAHRDQLRKGTDLPYVTHPAHVSIILLRHGFGEDLAIAGLLHDVVEDTDTSLRLIAVSATGSRRASSLSAVSVRPAKRARRSTTGESGSSDT